MKQQREGIEVIEENVTRTRFHVEDADQELLKVKASIEFLLGLFMTYCLFPLRLSLPRKNRHTENVAG